MNADRTAQTWQWVARRDGTAAYREVSWRKGQAGDALVQKLATLAVPLAEEESLDLAGTVGKLRDAFDRDKVTKKFFDHFKAEHKAFLGAIDGIAAESAREWYASVMLNRLMFVYFIQKKRFLAGDEHYLRNRLNQVGKLKGKGKFQTFYRLFLLKLFHEGFNKPLKERKLEAELKALIGNVPYLNGGLFDLHDLEDPKTHPDLDIPDAAFTRLFTFFDGYDWHLDVRPLATGKEIDPDILGYIFEKYINQKQMGAYYTKEDITDYIGKNTIVPRLFDMAKAGCAVAFEPGSALWCLLSDNPDRYLYPAVRKGVIDERGEIIPLPAEIEKGVLAVPERRGWNRPAAAGFGLPTETWREHVARRKRCLEIRAQLRAGEVSSINDLITLNLDIRKFAADVLDTCEGPDLLRAFYNAIIQISVLDPTCGSGAFLFAALNILQPIYDACLRRMNGFVADAEVLGKPAPQDFVHWLNEAKSHPNRDYFVLKSIIVRNLYGVDIMEEAVEICKLRLFLKLVAQVEPDPKAENQGLEPLPDIDFNIRAGNTLVGFATKVDVEKAHKGEMGHEAIFEEIVHDSLVLSNKFKTWRDHQAGIEAGTHGVEWSKTDLRKDLDKLRDQLDRMLAGVYGVDADKPKKFAEWRSSHQPFHWFAEFYGIMARGGFDVVIGNPPYVEFAKTKGEYLLMGYETIKCGNLFVYVYERCFQIAMKARLGLILPLSLLSTDRMIKGRRLFANRTIWASSYDIRPASLFEGIAQRLTILLQDCQPRKGSESYSGGYRRWANIERENLVQLSEFASNRSDLDSCLIVKVSSNLECSILSKIAGPLLVSGSEAPTRTLYVHRICRYFIKSLDFVPYFKGADGKLGKSEDYKPFIFKTDVTDRISCLLNSSLFYWYWRSYGDGFHCGYGDVERMPLADTIRDSKYNFEPLLTLMMNSLKQNSILKTIRTQKGAITYQEFSPAASALIRKYTLQRKATA